MDDGPHFMSDEVIEKRDAAERAIRDYIATIRPTDDAYVVAWAVGVEWTNVDLEQRGFAGRDAIVPLAQSCSATAGLGLYLTSRFGHVGS